MVRKITMNDIEALTKLFVNVFNNTPWKEQWTHKTANKRLQDLIHTPGFRGMVLYEGNVLSGLVMGRCEQNYDGLYFHVMELCVNQSRQEMELGKELLSDLMNFVKKDNVTKMYMYTKPEHMLKAIFEECGFVENSENSLMMRRI